METTFSQDERARIHQEIRRKYARAARSPEGLFPYSLRAAPELESLIFCTML